MFKTLKSRLMLSFSVIILSMVALLVVVETNKEYHQILSQNTEILDMRLQKIHDLLKERTSLARSLANWIALDPKVQELFAAQDRNGLRNTLLPVFQNAKGKNNISQFQFHLPPATSFLRLHKPSHFGDDLSSFRHTVVQANAKRQMMSGIERGRHGAGLRAVAPVSYAGKHVGTVEFGLAVNDKLLETFKQNNGFDVSFLMEGKQGLAALARNNNRDVNKENSDAIRDVLATESVHTIEQDFGDGVELVLYAPLRDFSGKTIGVIVLPENITPAMNHLHAMIWSIIGFGILITAIILGMMYFILNKLVDKPLSQIVGGLAQVKEGNYTLRLNDSFQGELATVAFAINGLLDTVEQALAKVRGESQIAAERAADAEQSRQDAAGREEEMRELLKRIKDTAKQSFTIADNLGRAGKHLEAQAQDVTQGMATQKNHVRATVTAVEEMNSTVLEVAHNAANAASNAERTRDKAQHGAEVVSEAVNAITQARRHSESLATDLHQLDKHAEGIDTIITVITDIADQTNLLALNAAIEAARAGEAGRGFAVVADEVRKLAEKTMVATQEVGDSVGLIKESVLGNLRSMEQATSAVNDASQLAERSGMALEEIVEFARNTSDMVTSIATASEQQSVTSQEITQAVGKIDAVSDHTNEQMHQASKAIMEVMELASALHNSFTALNLNDHA